MIQNYRISILVALLLFVAAASLNACGRGSAPAQPAPIGDRSTSFVLTVDSQSTLIDGAKATGFTLDEQRDGDEVTVLVKAHGAVGLKAAYFTLSYDRDNYTPLSAEQLDGLGGPAKSLHIAVLNDPGTIHFGEVLKNWDKAEGYSGELQLAKLTLATNQPGNAVGAVAKQVSTPPLTDASAVGLVVAGFTHFGWLYANQGDYNQDGLVGIEDLTPLGLHFGESGLFLIDSVQAIVDGNKDGEINISDITPIGLNFGASTLGGYNIYASTDIHDYPTSNSATSLIAPLDSIALADSTGDRTAVRRLFSKDITPPAATFYAWVRPVDESGTEGTPSDMKFVDAAGPPALSLVDPALAGGGTLPDPYVVDATVDYQIELNHATLGDITDAVGVSYTVEPLDPGHSAGSVNPSARQLQIEDAFTGMFSLSAKFNGIDATPVLYFRVLNPGNAPPTAFFMADPTSGAAPLDVTADASGSSDTDGVIILYEWDFDGDGTWDLQNTLYDSAFADFSYPAGGRMNLTLRVTDDNGATDTTSFPIDVEGWEKILIDDRDGAGTDPSLALIDGNPAIAYGDTGGNINYVRATDSTGDTWGGALALSNVFSASEITMMEVDGGPGIAYRRTQVGDNGIHYAWSPVPSGAGWNRETISTGANDHSPSLQVVGGYPAIAYVWDSAAPDLPYTLSYIRSSEVSGTGSGSWDSFPSLIFTANYMVLDKQSLVLTQDKPSIFFLDNDDELSQFWKVRYVIADDVAATGWGFPAPLYNGDPTHPAHYLAVTTIVERGNIAWRADDPGVCSFRRCSNLDGTGWLSIFEIPDGLSNDTRGFFLDIANVAGFPAICHYDKANKTLRYANSLNVDGSLWDASVVANVGEWDTGLTDNNFYVSLAANAGKPMMAYYDANDFHLYFSKYYEIP